MGELAMRAVTAPQRSVTSRMAAPPRAAAHARMPRRLVDEGSDVAAQCRQRCTAHRRPATTSTPSCGRTRPRRRRRRSSGRLPSPRRGPAPAPARSAPTGFSRTTASSMACALTASVNCAISARAASSCQSRCTPGRRLRQSRQRGILTCADTDHGRHIHTPLRAASAWRSPRGDLQKDLPLVSADRRRSPPSTWTGKNGREERGKREREKFSGGSGQAAVIGDDVKRLG